MSRVVAASVLMTLVLSPMASLLCVTTCHDPGGAPCHRSADPVWQGRSHTCDHDEVSTRTAVRRVEAPSDPMSSMLETAPLDVPTALGSSHGLTLLPGFDPPSPALRI